MALRFQLSLILLLTISRLQASLALASAAPAESFRSTDESLKSLHKSDFPEGFIFGAGSAAYQIEGGSTAGGRGKSNWDTWAHAGNIQDGSTGDVAADEYHRYEEDVEILADLNMDAYRFSISWTRIFPDGFGPDANKEGIAYYNRLIDYLLSKGIQPYATLFHWELPQTLQDSFGGWMSRKIVDPFVAFAEVCFAAFGDRVKNWITVNEADMFAYCGYCDGMNPPGRSSSPHTEVYIVAHNVLLAHGAAMDIYRKKFQAQQMGVIGISLQVEFVAPLTNSSEDIDAAERRLEFQLSWLLDPMFFGDYPAVMRENVGSRLPKFSPDEIALLDRAVDFIGLNHYTTKWATVTGSPAAKGICTTLVSTDQRVNLRVERDNVKIGPQVSTWINMVPWGLYGVLKWISSRYNNTPIYITENGLDYPSLPRDESLRDTARVRYFQEYLAAALAAVREGVDLRAYFAWSFLDGLEWRNGYTTPFGIVYVDFNDGLKRYPKDSALWFKKFLQPLREYS